MATQQSLSGNVLSNVLKSPGANWRRQPKTSGHAKPPRPTHFLCLPLGHHSELQERVKQFHSTLLEGPVEGLDPSILIKPRRLHLTLGVMSLASSSPKSAGYDSTASPPVHTIDSALQLLRSLQPKLSLLSSTGQRGTLCASLERVGAFESNHGARVLWVSPREDEGWSESEEEVQERLKLVQVAGCVLRMINDNVRSPQAAETIHQTFRNAGYITDNRPLKLHCTLINTSHRKPSSKVPKLFSYADVLASKALSVLQPSAEGSYSPPNSTDRLARVSLGTYDIPEIQLCAMGSHGPEDEYISLGGVGFMQEGTFVN
ncbi:hypothetical protein D9757_004162 [Collybiopsis confluens]|uniref:A-kinase anchor protein 7-like phosphoesterase domain-containing protein n=1 Tax=Collybiopsis confluens TaxID=2823264 RepID=A0A8H5HU47_9AGAR|nr:hypothetical protein D9757_004162 [Collybiopsis confluens]